MWGALFPNRTAAHALGSQPIYKCRCAAGEVCIGMFFFCGTRCRRSNTLFFLRDLHGGSQIGGAPVPPAASLRLPQSIMSASGTHSAAWEVNYAVCTRQLLSVSGYGTQIVRILNPVTQHQGAAVRPFRHDAPAVLPAKTYVPHVPSANAP